jgi:hypothetical protein
VAVETSVAAAASGFAIVTFDVALAVAAAATARGTPCATAPVAEATTAAEAPKGTYTPLALRALVLSGRLLRSID